MKLSTLFVYLFALGVLGAQPTRSWVLDAKPLLVLGNSESDSTAFAAVVGATRLPNGNILVGDRSAYALRLFGTDGKHLRDFARKGSGPGEITYLRFLLRCGDSLFTMDVQNGHRVAVFTRDGRYERTYRFGSPQAASVPYASVCNSNRVFAHYGWELQNSMKGGTFRALVPFWISGPDSSVRRVIGDFPGSERFGLVVKGQFRGTRPLPLGKEPAIAIGGDRVYIGTADRYEIAAFDFTGRRVATISKPNVNLAVTQADIDYSIDQETAGRGDSIRARVASSYAQITLPKTVPAYAAMVVDREDLLWVQDYPRPQTPLVRWSIFDRSGTAVAESRVPTHLRILEVGRDYVLGSYLDPEEAVPEVRLYRLARTR
ncbi:MAG: hypothetical protein ACT4P6_07820 [Gemmatimonadaceae bacterium]